ncbi:MAG: cellulase family glycosylhydrolase, partial [Thermoplasmata archaeon]
MGQIIDVKTTSAHSGVEVLSRLHVDGNLIKNESGATVILRGINIADPYVLQLEGHFSETDFSFIVENWHPNIIRIPIHPRWWSPTYIDDYLVPLVSWGQKYKVYILLDYHDFGNPSNRLNLIKSTWNDIVSRFAGNPAVLYDIFNEPHSMFWFQWKPMAEDIIATIRSVDPDSLIFVGGVDWGYSLVGAGSNPISYDNIVYSTHPYPMKSTPWDTYFGFLTSSHPVFAGEWGFIDDGSGEVWDADRTYAVRLLYYLEKKGMSWAAWCLHPTWRPNLLQDWTYTPTESGYLIKDWLLESHLDSYEVGGLRSQYFDNKNFTDLGIERINPSIDFDWGSGSPDVAIGSETFSARWIGKVKVDFAETFTFHTYTDDGARLWVDGQFLINKWVDQAATEWSGSITLDIGLHSILLEYYENTGSAVARLSWSSPSVAKETIPNSHLSHMVHPIYDTTPPES